MAFEVISTDQLSSYTVNDFDIVTLLAGVSVTASGAGLQAGDDGDTVFTGVELTIFGTVVGSNYGIDFNFGLMQVSGTDILIGEAGAVVGQFAGIFLEDPLNVHISNHGLIAGTTGIASEGPDGTLTIFNSGTIEGRGESGISVNLDIGVVRIENTGTIRGEGGTLSPTIDVNAPLRLINSGTIIGSDGRAVSGSSEADVVLNSGLIRGNVSLGNGNDLYSGSGTGWVTGQVDGSFGRDLLRGSDAGDLFSGNFGDDTLIGRGGDDTLNGGIDSDLVQGGTGDDNIFGGPDNDTANGNAGDDSLYGGSGDDQMRGGRDDDLVQGDDGADTLRGDSGDDRIIGGQGRDDMFGGSGRDTFIFENLTDSGTGAARDRIYDFQSGTDTLDISALAGPAFSYLGSSNFTGGGSPEVRAVSVANGTLIYIDANGDGTRDSDIYLIGTEGVTEGDFLL